MAEDDTNIRTGLVDTLESEGYAVSQAPDGQVALELFQKGDFQLVLLDIMMPKKSGYDVCRQIRLEDWVVPVIMLTAKAEEIDKVLGLELGADDYITKPFGVHELLARISAVLRRVKRGQEKPLVQEGDFSFGSARVNAKNYKIINQGIEIDLSKQEMKLLRFFHDNPNEVLSRDRMLNAVWGVGYYGTTRTLDQHISQLRKKIEPDPSTPRSITTVHGIGYRYMKS